MTESRYFLGNAYADLSKWDEVSEDTYMRVRHFAKKHPSFKSDSMNDTETYFEAGMLCGARVTSGDVRLKMFFPEAELKCVNDTDGDGDCAFCARSKNTMCRQPVWEKLPPYPTRVSKTKESYGDKTTRD